MPAAQHPGSRKEPPL